MPPPAWWTPLFRGSIFCSLCLWFLSFPVADLQATIVAGLTPPFKLDTPIVSLWPSCRWAVLRSGLHCRPVRPVARWRGGAGQSTAATVNLSFRFPYLPLPYKDIRLVCHKLNGIRCCFSSFTDIINGAQEKCVLPPMDGYPHCEGKIKVRPQ